MSINIVIVDDLKLCRQVFRGLLEKEPDMKVVGEAPDGRETIRLVEQLLPQVVLMDVNLPDQKGGMVTSRLKEQFPGIKVIGLSLQNDRRTVSEMLTAGAAGYILKDWAFEDLAQAIRQVMADHIYLGTGVES